MISCDDSWIPQVAEYIGEDKIKCFYLYADMKQFGTSGEHFGLWVCQDGGEISGVAYRYYDTLHLFSREPFPEREALSLIDQLEPKCIMATGARQDQLVDKLEDRYTKELYHVISSDGKLFCPLKRPLELATVDDVPEIVSVMMDDPVYSDVYKSRQSLSEQMAEGIRTGLRRMYVLRDKNREILAINGSFAEIEGIAALSGLVTSQRARGKGLGPVASVLGWNKFVDEGKRPIGFVSSENENSMAMHQKLGFKFAAEYWKLLRRDDEVRAEK